MKEGTPERFDAVTPFDELRMGRGNPSASSRQGEYAAKSQLRITHCGLRSDLFNSQFEILNAESVHGKV
jgi:hypothetical protein